MRSGGFVYFIQSEHGGPVKIGYARDPIARLMALQIAHAYRLEILKAVRGTPALEQRLHRQFADQRLLGEWFEDCPELQAEIARRPGLSRPDLEFDQAA